MKRRRLSWPWAVGRQCVTRVGSGRVGFRVAGALLDSFVQSTLSSQPSTRRIRSSRSFHSQPSTRWVWFDSLAHWPWPWGGGLGWGGRDGGGRRGGARRQPRPAGWLLAARQLAEGDGRSRGDGGREAGAGVESGPVGAARQLAGRATATGPSGSAWRLARRARRPGWASARAWVREGARSEETGDPGVGRTHSPTHIP